MWPMKTKRRQTRERDGLLFSNWGLAGVGRVGNAGRRNRAQLAAASSEQQLAAEPPGDAWAADVI